MFWSLWKLFNTNSIWLSKKSKEVFNLAKNNHNPSINPSLPKFWKYLKELDSGLNGSSLWFSSSVMDYILKSIRINTIGLKVDSKTYDNTLIWLTNDAICGYLKDSWQSSEKDTSNDFRKYIFKINNGKEVMLYWQDRKNLFFFIAKQIYMRHYWDSDSLVKSIVNLTSTWDTNNKSFYEYLAGAIYRESINDKSSNLDIWCELSKNMNHTMKWYLVLYKLLRDCYDSNIRIWDNTKLCTNQLQKARQNILKYAFKLLEKDLITIDNRNLPDNLKQLRQVIWNELFNLIIDLNNNVDIPDLFLERSDKVKWLVIKSLFLLTMTSKNLIDIYNKNNDNWTKFVKSILRERYKVIKNVYNMVSDDSFKNDTKNFIVDIIRKSPLKTSIIKKKFLDDLWISI